MECVDSRLADFDYVKPGAKGRVYMKNFKEWYSFSIEGISLGGFTGTGRKKVPTININIIGENHKDEIDNGASAAFKHVIKSLPATNAGMADINAWSCIPSLLTALPMCH